MHGIDHLRACFGGNIEGKLHREMDGRRLPGNARRMFKFIACCFVFGWVLVGVAIGAQAQTGTRTSGAGCDRACMAGMVDEVLSSMVAHDPYALPLAEMYEATENSHPAALGMMTSWRTITKTGKPSLLAIDTQREQAYFMLTASESGSSSVLSGRIKVEGGKITELELFINRSRGDHGFSFSPEQLPSNFRKLMSPPPNRQKASREELEQLAEAVFDPSSSFKVDQAPDCQFTEVGWRPIDPGLDDQPTQAVPSAGAPPSGQPPSGVAPAGCVFFPSRPADKNARVIAVDEDMGFVVVGAIAPGMVYPHPYNGHILSTFITSSMTERMKAHDEWMQRKLKEGGVSLLKPMPASSETLQVLQFYDGKLQGELINAYLSGRDMRSDWLNYDSSN